MASRGLIIDGVGAAFRFLATAWTRAWGSMGIVGLLFGCLWATGLLSPHSPWRVQALLLALSGVVIVDGGLYRLALREGAPGPAGLQWGRVEWRLSAVFGLSLLFLFVLGLLAFVVLLAFGFAVASAGRGFVTALPMTWAGAVDGRGRTVLAIVGVFALGALVWAGTRISLASAASTATGRIQVLASWPRTRGLVWPIILGRLLLGAAPLGLAAAIVAALSRLADPAPWVVWTASLAAGVSLAGGWLPLNAGFMAYLYRR